MRKPAFVREAPFKSTTEPRSKPTDLILPITSTLTRRRSCSSKCVSAYSCLFVGEGIAVHDGLLVSSAAYVRVLT
mgnify:CR=1 FL=1